MNPDNGREPVRLFGPPWPALGALWTLSVTLAFLVFQYGGVRAKDWNTAVIGIAAVSLALLFYDPRGRLGPPPLPPVVFWCVLLLPLYVLLQIIPLPIGLVSLISGTRAGAVRAAAFLGWAPGFVTLSVAPGTTLFHFARVCGYVLTFWSLRKLAGIFRERPWIVVFPLVLIALGEAGVDFYQMFTRSGPSVEHGTYINRNHFSGLLEMMLALPLVFALSAARKKDRAKFVAALAIVFAIAAAIVDSFSRSGMVAALVAIGMVFIAWRRAWKLAWILVPGAAVATLVVATSSVLIDPADLVRSAIWRDTLRLIEAYPLTGAGLGTFETAFLPFKRAAPMYAVDFAHNDYLQLWSELGTVGFAVVLMFSVGMFREISRCARGNPRAAANAVGMAALAGLSALAMHSLTDFNLYIPANAMTAAWLSGAASGLAGGSKEC